MSELSPLLKQRFFDVNGLPLAGGQLFSYAAGTTIPLATYTDETGVTPNTNPVILDSGGYAPVWIGNNSYKFILQDSLGNTQFTVDNVQSIASQVAAITTTFQSVVVSYSQLQTAATTNAIAIIELPANSILGAVIIKHTTPFLGPGITDMYTQVGPSGAYDELIEHFDVFQAVGDQVFDNVSANYVGSFANTTAIYLNATSVGANLSALTQGSLTVYYKYETL